MASYRYLILLLLFIISACAQVGTITGGGPDASAPKPISEKVVPLNGSTNFHGNHLEIPFDEFFKLKNPAENIVMVPPHAKINARFKGKTLLLDWDDTLNPNTTYAIYLNSAIQDLTESNDSIIQYVFSTGDVLDTLSYRIQLRDAWTNKPVTKATVILFDKNTLELKSFASTDSKGFAQMNYLRSGEYTISAFKDLNSDLEYQKNEPVAFAIDEEITLLESRIDSIPYRMFTPILDPKITTKQFIGPNTYVIAANRSLLGASFTINQTSISEENLIYHSTDSVQLFWNTDSITKAEITVDSEFFNDTISLRFSENTVNSPLLFKSINRTNTFAPSDTVGFILNDLITSVDTSLIKIKNSLDSTALNTYNYSIQKNKLYFIFDKADLSRLAFEFLPEAISGIRSQIGLNEFIITLNPQRKYGTIDLNLSYYHGPIIVQTIKDGTFLFETTISSPTDSFKLNELAPGQYTFIIVEDENGNGKWDVGDYTARTQPETLDVFSTPTKVRANWEVVVELIPSE